MVERNFWSPSITSQFRICPIPFHFDTYRGCQYGCIYCFARDFIEFQRRNAKTEQEKRQSFLVGNSPQGLQKWINKVNDSEYNYKKAEEVAWKERIPVKIGATADPFPIVEKKERITYECLKIFDKYDYPVQISTKNPEVFEEYASEFVNSNIALNVSCSFCDDDIARKIEVGTISPSRRMESVRRLSQMGYKITMRLQPFILPYSENVAERFVAMLKENGVWAFQTEGLKLRLSMSPKEKAIYAKIGDYLGFDIINDFALNGDVEGGDRVYNEERKRRILELYDSLSKKYDIKFFNADNLIDKRYGCGSQCCGTEFLRNFKIWGGCMRSRVFDNEKYEKSIELGKCLVNFTRATKQKGVVLKTIGDVSDEYAAKEIKRLRELEFNKKHQQLDLFE